jgi:hypothetical protein
MRPPLPADDQVNAVMARVLAQAAETGRKATVTAVERALGIPHATFDRNYRHLIDDFRQRAHDQSTTAKRTRATSSGKDPARSYSGSAGRTKTSGASSRSTPNPSASSRWTTSNSKPDSTPPPASPPAHSLALTVVC